MVTEIVLFALPAGMTRETVLANFRQTAPKWRANPDLRRKSYLCDAERRLAGGVYVWSDPAAARRWHDEAWLAMVERLYGARPTIQLFETPIVVDNVAGELTDLAA
jgi:hypothetical protein